jgi:tetratricopeptide (TPR) repeat protein
MIDNIYERYSIPANYQKERLGTLYYILRKAELAKDLTCKEWDWLGSQEFNDTIGIIKSQEENRKIIAEYRSVLAAEVRDDLINLRQNKFVKDTILATPTVDSERALAWFKIHNLEELSDGELDLADKSYKFFLSFSKLKNKYGITEDIPSDIDSLKRLSKIELRQSLCVDDFEWLHKNAIVSVLHLVVSQTSELLNKYECEASSLSPLDSLKLFLSLQKIEEGLILKDEEQQFLAQKGYTLAHGIAQTAEFIGLKKQYHATQFESNDPTQHLYKVLKKIQAEKSLPEPDINYLKKRKLDQTVKYIYQRKADQLVNKVQQDHGLTNDDMEWCKEYNFPEIIFPTLKVDYAIKNRKDSIESPLYSILLKLNSEQRLSDNDVIWLEAEELIHPNTKIFIAHHRLEALHAENEFKRTRGYWNLVNASAHWRKANEPKLALKLTNNLQQLRALKEAKLKSALLTTRGGALRDLDQLSDAENCALEAINLFPNSHNPYTLMGALYYDTGRYEEGDEWFEKAVKRGAKSNDQESEIRRILSKKKGKEHQQIIDHLLAKDPTRFGWVKRYAPK